MAKMYRIKSLTERSRVRYVRGEVGMALWCDRGQKYPPGDTLFMVQQLREHSPEHEWALEPVDE